MATIRKVSRSPSIRSGRKSGRTEDETLPAPGSRTGQDPWERYDPWDGNTGKGKGSHVSGDGGYGPKGPPVTYGPQRKESWHAFSGSGYPSFEEQSAYPPYSWSSDMGKPMPYDPMGAMSGQGKGASNVVFGNTSQQVPFVPNGFPPMTPMQMSMMWQMMMGMSMKGNGKGFDDGQNRRGGNGDQKKKKRGKKAPEGEEDKKGGEGGPGGEDPSDHSGTTPTPTDPSLPGTETESSVGTTAIRSMLKRRQQRSYERPKSSLGSIKIEEYYGERSRYRVWKKAVEAQQALYRLDPEELSMLIYLSTRKDARDCLDQRALTEFTVPGGLQLIWQLLDAAFGETEDEVFERAEQEYNQYRRAPGQPVASYIGQMKRLKAQYMRVDPETRISDRAWGQKLLNRCSLTRRERLDVFFSAGGVYDPRTIEVALRHRCAKVHEDERRVPMARVVKPFRPRNLPDGSNRSRPTSTVKKFVKKTYVADGEQDEEAEEDGSADEDLEEESGAYEAYLEGNPDDEEGGDAHDHEVEEPEDEMDLADEDLKEAYAAGWKAKAKMSERKKTRGFSGGGNRPKPSGPKSGTSIDDMKKSSTCSSCGEKGHWKGDPQCAKVKAGIDPLHQRKTGAAATSKSTNYVNFTFAVTTKTEGSKKQKAGVKSEGPMAVPEMSSCPKCRWPIHLAAKFCGQCGQALTPDERMAEGKRGWTVVESSQSGEDELIVSSGSSSRKTEEEKLHVYTVRKDLLKEAAGHKKERPKSSQSRVEDEMVKATPEEILASLPLMTKEERKALKKKLAAEEKELAFKSMTRHQILMAEIEAGDPEAASSHQDRAPKQMPIPKAKSVEKFQGYMDEVRNQKLPKAVKDKMLLEFREGLYEAQVRKGRLMPSKCAPAPTEEQVKCSHPFERLRWSANGDGHYASCRDCGLRHVIYFSEKHGAMMVDNQETEDQPVNEVFFHQNPGLAIVDSGCRTAVAGRQWHESFQGMLKEKGYGWHEEAEDETFKFGAGGPEKSKKAFLYPVGVHGFNEVLRISCVQGGAADCPGLIGPSELARWGVMLDFAAKMIQVKAVRKPMFLMATRHPALDLMDFAGGDPKQFWEGNYIKETLQVLKHSPHTWAFWAGQEEQEEESVTEDESEDLGKKEEVDTEEEETDMWPEAVEALQRDLQYMPLQPAQDQEHDQEEEVQGEHSEADSISSHEFGVELHEEESEESEDEVGEKDTWKKKVMSKGQKTDVGHSVHVLKECLVNESKKKREEEEQRTEAEVFVSRGVRKRQGQWKVLEIFTWTCMISMCAVETGRWSMMEPITLPRWNLLEAQDRQEALEYLDREDPDLLVLAWPCTVWSQLQTLGRKTFDQLQRLAERRQEQRVLLDFVQEASRRQRSRGGAILGENPWTSKAWDEEAIIKAFEGMPHGDTDMCAYGLQKPTEEDPWQRRLYLKKRTKLAGTEEIIEECSRKCPQDHVHAPVVGGVRVHGKWMALSDFAGGYTRSFARSVLRGAEKYLKSGRRKEVFVVSETFAEESLCPAEDEMKKEGQEAEPAEDELTQKRGQLMMIHKRLGHPTNQSLARMLRLAGAEKWLIEEAVTLKCPTCPDMKPPPKPMTQRSDMRPVVFNELLGIDLKYGRDTQGQLYVALSMVDLATNYHRAVLLRNREPAHVSKKLLSHWIAVFGVPKEITLDQGGEWEAEFLLAMEQNAIATRFTGSHAAWQLGHAERHGALLGVAWGALIHEHKIVGREGMKVTLLCAQQAKNEVVTRRGYSANALVFGRQCNFPDLLDDETNTTATLGQALSQDTEVARQAEMRAAAKRALLHQDAQEKLKRALVLRPKAEIREYLPGEKIFFWVPNPARKVRYRSDPGAWRGPAMVITKESNEKYFVSWRGRCLLLASANMRGATIQDNADVEEGISELRKLEEMWQSEGRQYEDVSESQKEIYEEPKDTDLKFGGQEDALVPKKKIGRTRREAVQMMRGLKSVRRVLKDPIIKPKKKRGRPPKRRNQEVEKQDEEMPQEQIENDELEEKEEEWDEFWKEVHEQEDKYVREDKRRLEVTRQMSEAERKRRSLDDVPHAMKRKIEDQEVTEDEMRRKLQRSFFSQVQVMVSDQHLPEKLRDQVQNMADKTGKKNQWISRKEVKQLARLLDMPITSARLHRAPRKRMQKPPGGKQRGRLSVMLLQEEGQALVVHEKAEEVKKMPRKKAPSMWRGLTMFTRMQTTTIEREQEEVYIQVKNEVFKATVNQPERWKELKKQEEKRDIYHQVLVLQLKSSGKELDPRWFNEEEAQKFAESDLKEWEAWIKNGVIQRLTEKEAKEIPRSAIFKAPLRMVRVNKSKDQKELQPKSRLVVPGHLDPGLGEYRSDSPTTTPTAVRMIKTICVTLDWQAFVFDVSTAFLSGKNTSRMVYVKAPPEGLPATKTSTSLQPYELMRIVKSAYGLSEAPRLWYLRAVELLQQAGMVEIPFCRSTFIAKDKKGKVYALCALHVDDGFYVGDSKNPEFLTLKEKIDTVFTIKAWENIGSKGVEYLGMTVYYDQKKRIMIDDMGKYVEKIEGMKSNGEKTQPLSPKDLTSFRQLVMRMRWPCQHVMPEYMYRVSALAQRVSKANYEDVKTANVLLKEMQDTAKGGGGAKLTYRAVVGEPCFVSYFDASLGKKDDGTAQQGEVHLLTDTAVTSSPRTACLIEFHSNKIARVVRSSMAAESCALATATDKQLYNRLLYGALRNGDLEVPSTWREKLCCPGYMITDAKSLFDHCHKTGHLAQERQTALDLLMVKGLIENNQLYLRWVPTFRQLADSLTKNMKDVLLTAFKREGQVCIVSTKEDEVIEERRAKIRKGQRERRTARMKKTSSQQVLLAM